MATPYITPAILQAKPAGLAWQVVPTLTADSQAQQAQIEDVCRIATSLVDTCCRQPLRSTVNTESVVGPGRGRMSVHKDTGIGSLVTRRWPVQEVLAVQTSPARSFPPSWTSVPGDQCSIRYPVLSSPFGPDTVPSGGNVVDVAPGWFTWDLGRGGWRVQHSTVSGWAHAGLTALALAGATTVDVDDVTGWAGSAGWIYDGTSTELVTCTTAEATTPADLPNGAGTVQAGPGTLTLAAPLEYGHGAGTVVSALPETALRGAALFCAVQAIETIDAIATQSLSGEIGSTSMLAQAAEDALCGFRRII